MPAAGRDIVTPSGLEVSCDPRRIDVSLEFRNRGIAKMLMRAILAHADLQGLRAFLLATRDAHKLYAQFGFAAVHDPERLMGRRLA